MRLRWLVGLVLAVLTVAMQAGCGDGESLDEETRELLEQIVIRAEDLPSGLERASAFFSTNEEVAEAQSSSAEELAKLEEWGRRLGYDVSFALAPDPPPDLVIRGLQSTASLYDAEQGASASFAAGVSSARDSDWEARYSGLSELEVTEIERPDIADELLWVRASGFEGEEAGALLVDDQVALRVGRVRAFLRVVMLFEGEVDRSIYMDQVAGWAHLMSGRISEALATSAGS